MKLSRTIVAMLIVGTACLPLVGCGTDQQEAPEQPAANTGTNSGTQPPASDGQVDGAAIVSDRCGRCHPLQQVERASKDRAGWESTVSRMEGHGLQVTEEEREAVIDYLTERDANR